MYLVEHIKKVVERLTHDDGQTDRGTNRKEGSETNPLKVTKNAMPDKQIDRHETLLQFFLNL